MTAQTTTGATQKALSQLPRSARKHSKKHKQKLTSLQDLAEIDKYMKMEYRDKLTQTIESAILYEFRDIQNLNVKNNEGTISVTFDEGKYTKQEVENYIQELRNMKPLQKSESEFRKR